MSVHRVRVLYFSTWADGLQDAREYLDALPRRDLRPKVRDPQDAELMRMARLDCDWDGECLRAFAAMEHPDVEFLPARIADAEGLLRFVAETGPERAVPWLVLIDQKPAPVAPVIGRLLAAFRARGGHVLYWAYDDASRTMDCAAEIAPHLSVLIHDESPLADAVRSALPPDCIATHHSWVANIVPFAYPLCEEPERRIVFLGSKLGVTEHRQRQIRAMERHFGDRFECVTDHSIPVAERGGFSRIQVHLCPEGRKFATPSMSRSHTDRPFWAGCMGQVPVSEDSRAGGRLAGLVRAGRILGYPHGDTRAMIEACERALELDLPSRRAIYEHFNRHGTVGPIAASHVAARMAGTAVAHP